MLRAQQPANQLISSANCSPGLMNWLGTEEVLGGLVSSAVTDFSRRDRDIVPQPRNKSINIWREHQIVPSGLKVWSRETHFSVISKQDSLFIPPCFFPPDSASLPHCLSGCGPLSLQ